jgi:putative phosphoesterase
MRIAFVSDIHGNLAAFEAVLADLAETSPDLILHGGDLADNGAHPVEIVDRIRDLGWQGVAGNTDEMLVRPAALTEFANQSPHLQALFDGIAEMAAWTREALGEARLRWLGTLPARQLWESIALVHGTPDTSWRAPGHEASNSELQSVYAPLGRAVAIYAHIHRPFIREVPGMLVCNTGSVGLPYDGDRRASYLLIELTGKGEARIRRVEYDIDREVKALLSGGLPRADGIAKMLSR